jgi:uncharacterized membrane protein YesL
MIAGAKVVWWAVRGIWDETLTLLKANLVWFLLSLPLGLPVLAALASLMPSTPGDEYSTGLASPLLLTGLLLVLIPNPASLGLCRLAAIMQRRDSPPWQQFWESTWQNLRLGLALYAIGLLGLVLLGVHIVFYLRVDQPMLRLLSLLWLYLTLFWLALQIYLGPLVMLLGERRLLSLYRRAALLVLAHPLYTITFLLAIALLMVLCLIMVPLYPAMAMAFVALIGTRALGELKRRYDPSADSDGEPG